MHKIPTIFERAEPDEQGRRPVIPVINPLAAWVWDDMERNYIVTEKLDGTNVRLTVRQGEVVRVEKRRNPKREQKERGILDPWYVDASRDNPQDRWIFLAVDGTDTSVWVDGEHCCEALGPSIQGNPLGFEEHRCIPFNLWRGTLEYMTFVEEHLASAETLFEYLRDILPRCQSIFPPHKEIEGLVIHHRDGRKAKIKTKDFL